MRKFVGRNTIGYILALGLVGAFLVAHEAYVTRAHPDAPFMDTLRLVYQLEEWLAGRMSFFEFWRQEGQHQGFITQLFLLANTKLFSMNILLANRMTGVAVALLTGVLLFNFVAATNQANKSPSVSSLMLQAAIGALIASVCFSWAGWEIFTLDLGLPLWTKNLSFVVYFAIHAWYIRADPAHRVTRVAGLGLTLIGPVVVLVIGMGWSYAFVAAVVFVSAVSMIASFRRAGLRGQIAKSTPLIALLIAQLVYVAASVYGARSANAMSSAPSHVPSLVLYALGSGVFDQEMLRERLIPFYVSEWVGAYMLVAAAVLVLSRFRRNTLDSYSLLPFYLLAYGFFTAFSVSVARGHDGPGTVMASRYYMDIMLFCVGLIWFWYEGLIRAGMRGSAVSATGFLMLCLIVAYGQRLDYMREWNTAPYRALAFKAMNKALLAGVPDQAAANLLQSPLNNARLGDKALFIHHFALYSDLSSSECKTSRQFRSTVPHCPR